MKLRCALTAAAILFVAMPADAQVVDVSKLRCEEFLRSGKDGIAYIVVWLDGYYTGEDDPSTMDFGQIARNIERFGDYCAKNPASTMTDAADAILGK